jgi:hypothetical protein
MRTRFRKTGVVILLALLGQAVSAQEVAVNRDPFSAPDIEEVVRAADYDRVAKITAELVEEKLSDLEQSIITEVERRLSSMLDRRLTEFSQQMDERMEARLSEMAGVVAGLRDEVPAEIERAIAERVRAGSSDAAAMGLLPEGSAFVACVDGKALYRDAGGSTFYADDSMGGSGVSRCSN